MIVFEVVVLLLALAVPVHYANTARRRHRASGAAPWAITGTRLALLEPAPS
jgi:hypothetical protein